MTTVPSEHKNETEHCLTIQTVHTNINNNDTNKNKNLQEQELLLIGRGDVINNHTKALERMTWLLPDKWYLISLSIHISTNETTKTTVVTIPQVITSADTYTRIQDKTDFILTTRNNKT